MSTDDQRAARSGRARAVSRAVARRSTRFRLVLEYLRAHDRLAEPASASGDRQGPPRARVAFWRYTAALDAEERAAEVYASLVRRVGHPATSDGHLSGPLAA
jgi:hypothetical protein